MVYTPERFRELVEEVQAGSDEAAWQLVLEFGDAIRRTVRLSLNPTMRKSFDSLDFVQLVWRSLFRAKEKLDRFDEPAELAAFLVVMARNKVCTEMRKTLFSQKRDASREESFDQMAANKREQIVDHRPLPSEIAVARERWEQLLKGQPDHYQQIIQLRLQGHSVGEIAERLHLAQSTVRRFLEKLRRDTAP